MVFDLAIIGGGAAGFFAALQVSELRPASRIVILEKTTKLLQKVRISGGGRCNVTHHCFNSSELSRHYPRGEKPLKQLFKFFNAMDMVAWCAQHGVDLKTEDDGRMFPVTDNSQTIIDCFVNEAINRKIKIELGAGVDKIKNTDDGFDVECAGQKKFTAQKILIAIGGHPNANHYNLMRGLGHTPVEPIPSLFTFNDTKKQFTDLMGVSVPNAEVRIAGTKFSEEGPLLITHWGLSGPAIIKLSAWAATYLHQQQYVFTALVSWIGKKTEDDTRAELQRIKAEKPKLKIVKNPLFALPQRLWTRLCDLAGIDENKVWGEVSNKHQNRLMEFLIRCPFEIKGKTTFKEEFVTCGGVDLNEIDLETMESKKARNVYFAGEVMNIDGETGGFNFQAAWTTAYVAASAIVK